MKKAVLLSSALLIGLCIAVACAPEKKGKLDQNTLTVKIEPPKIGQVANEASVQISAILVNAKGEAQDVDVIWSLSDNSLGNLSSNTSKTVTFTAAAAPVTGQGVITVDCGGIKKTANFSVGTATVDEIYVTASKTSLQYGAESNLTAVARAGGVPVADQPEITWSCSPANLGTLSATTGANVTFTANNSNNPGSVVVKASALGLDRSVTILVGSTETVKRFVYSDAGLGPNINSQYTIYGDWQWFPNNINSSSFTIADVSGCPADPRVAHQLNYIQGTLGDDPYAGLAFKFSTAQDLTEYTKLKFSVRGVNGGERFRVEFPDAANYTDYTASSSWEEKTIDIRPIIRYSVNTPINFVFKRSITGGNASIQIDYIYFETEN